MGESMWKQEPQSIGGHGSVHIRVGISHSVSDGGCVCVTVGVPLKGRVHSRVKPSGLLQKNEGYRL